MGLDVNRGIFLVMGAIGAGLVLVIMNVIGTSIFTAGELSTAKSTKASYKDLMDSLRTQCSNINNFDVVTSKTIELRVPDRDKIGYDGSHIYYEKNGQQQSSATVQNCQITWNTVNSGEQWVGGQNPDHIKWEAEIKQSSQGVLIEVENT